MQVVPTVEVEAGRATPDRCHAEAELQKVSLRLKSFLSLSFSLRRVSRSEGLRGF